jgi:hypothetical protein
MRRSWTIGLALAIALVALQALLVPLFAWPASHIAPRHLPIAVAGPPSAAGGVAGQLQAQHPDAFDVTVVADETAADAAIRDRSVYGAIVLGPAGPQLHVASAASPTVATLLTQAAAGMGQGGQPVPVRDVVPTDPNDPRGAALAAGFLPLAVTGLVAGALIFLAVRRRLARFGTLVVFGALAGLVGAAVQQRWLDILPGDYLRVSGVLGLVALAIAGTVAGLGALLGRPGAALGAITVFLVGNALSGVAAAPELLPRPWGEVGQDLPIGAGATLLRSVAYFDGHGGRSALLVLTAYAVGGLVLVLAGGARIRKRAGEAPPESSDSREPALAA